MKDSTFIITGGAGFIGSNFTAMLAAEFPGARIVVADALTYAGNISSIKHLIDSGRIEFRKMDITCKNGVDALMDEFEPNYVVNFAAESHVDRSVDDPTPFIDTNVGGTFRLLDALRRQRKRQMADGVRPSLKKYVQISTDEVYGDLPVEAPRQAPSDLCRRLGRDVTLYGEDAFKETSPINPSSPYSASKASADLLTLSYVRSFGLPAVVTRCSNNYGPFQFPEKLIPLAINNLCEGRPIPVYGAGTNVRDWIHVDDHCRGIIAALRDGTPGQVYNFGGYNEQRNIDLVHKLIDAFSALTGKPVGADAVTFVSDRPGHDRRYAIDAAKAFAELGWQPTVDPGKGLLQTVKWYLDNRAWIEGIIEDNYRDYYAKMYENRH